MRVTNLYATPWQLADGQRPVSCRTTWSCGGSSTTTGCPPTSCPRVLCREALDAGALKFQRWHACRHVAGRRVWLFRLPSGQFVAALSLDVHCELVDTIDLLEDCYFGDVQIGGTPVEEYAHALAVQLGADGSASRGFLPERHQIVFGAGPRPRTARTWCSG